MTTNRERAAELAAWPSLPAIDKALDDAERRGRDLPPMSEVMNKLAVSGLERIEVRTKAIEDCIAALGKLPVSFEGIDVCMSVLENLLPGKPEGEGVKRPSVVCLCGSTRFMETFFDVGWQFTLEGEIVLSVGVCKHVDHHGAEALGQDIADKLDELHLRKIDMADRVHILNVDGYIGESTQRELDYALAAGKPVTFLEEPEGEGAKAVCTEHFWARQQDGFVRCTNPGCGVSKEGYTTASGNTKEASSGN